MAGIDALGNWHLTRKGYPRYHTGKYRGQYVHRVWAARYRHRKLKRDEDVHHRNGNKLDWTRSNLVVLGHEAHGWITSKQHYYMQHIHAHKEAQSWEDYFSSEQESADFPFGRLDPTVFQPLEL